jgi:hypothetical protein
MKPSRRFPCPAHGAAGLLEQSPDAPNLARSPRHPLTHRPDPGVSPRRGNPPPALPASASHARNLAIPVQGMPSLGRNPSLPARGAVYHGRNTPVPVRGDPYQVRNLAAPSAGGGHHALVRPSDSRRTTLHARERPLHTSQESHHEGDTATQAARTCHRGLNQTSRPAGDARDVAELREPRRRNDRLRAQSDGPGRKSATCHNSKPVTSPRDPPHGRDL